MSEVLTVLGLITAISALLSMPYVTVRYVDGHELMKIAHQLEAQTDQARA